MKAETALEEIIKEFASATKEHGAFHSAHEEWAVLLEEMEELWDEVKLKRSKRDQNNMAKEAIQIAAMALRFLVDVVEVEKVS